MLDGQTLWEEKPLRLRLVQVVAKNGKMVRMLTQRSVQVGESSRHGEDDWTIGNSHGKGHFEPQLTGRGGSR